MQRYNLVVIGAGSAGLVVAAGAAGLGARVALVERGRMGGDCLNYGCVPSKALLRSAKAAVLARDDRFGLPAAAPDANLLAQSPLEHWPGVAARVRSVIAAIAPHDSVERFESLGVEVLQGEGRITSPRTVDVQLHGGGTRTLEARALVIATGSGPLVPPIPGLAEAGFLTNETVFDQPALPRRLCVLGGGPIGVELSQALARLGSRVTVVEMLPRILPREDADAAAVVAQALAADGVSLRTGCEAVRVEHGGGGKRVILRPVAGPAGAPGPEEALEVDEVLVAVGRRAQLADVGLDRVGVATEHGRIRVDARMRTSVSGIYACGDAVGPYQFTHMANQQARVVIQNALLPFKARMDYRVVPWCTFTDPELARVGLNEADALEAGTPHRVIRVPLDGVDRAVCDGETAGFLKVLTPPGRDDILGATLVGAHAGELLHEIVLAMQARLRLRDLAATVHIYPTLAEVFRRAGDEARKAAFTPRLQKLLRGYLRWRRR